MKTSEIFAACIPLLENKTYDYICHALCQVTTGDGYGNWRSFRMSRNPQRLIIMDRLGGCGTMVSICIQLNIGVSDILGLDRGWISGEDTLRQFRIEWLKSLVEEFQVKGD